MCSSDLDTDSLSLSLYGTFPFSEKTYIDSTLGVGKIRTNLTRIHESGTLTGNRKGEQVFSTILYCAEFENEVTLSPYGRIDAGYTKLKSYSDSGKVASINYNEQKIKTARASVGFAPWGCKLRYTASWPPRTFGPSSASWPFRGP